MTVADRFLQYVTVCTTADPAVETQPTSNGQIVLGEMLVKEMKAMGIADARIDENGYVYASIPATPGCEAAPAIGLIAHMDTSPDASGENVRPVVHPNYNGGDVVLANGSVLSTKVFEALEGLAGQTLITTSGDTLLGADDKAGIAEILTAVEKILEDGRPHGKLCIGFTPDEEVGRGADQFDVEAFGAKYAYTVDGGPVQELEYESFNAASAVLEFKGVSVHPGTAKDIMVNAGRLAAELDSLLPQDQRPEHTSGREGFFHMLHISGDVMSARSEYIIRDHSREEFEAKKQVMREAVAALEKRFGQGCVQLEIKDSYYNMGEVVEKHFHLVENAQKAIEAVGLTPKIKPIRGGTDGSSLSFMGLPCPNIGTGGLYAHGPNECITVEEMEKAVAIVLGIVTIYSTWQGE